MLETLLHIGVQDLRASVKATSSNLYHELQTSHIYELSFLIAYCSL